MKSELDVAGTRLVLRLAQDVRYLDRLGWRVRHKAPLHAILLFRRIVLQAGKVAAHLTLGVAQADTIPVMPLNHEQAEPADPQNIRSAGSVRFQVLRSCRLAVRGYSTRLGHKDDRALTQFEDTEFPGRGAGGKRDIVRGIAACGVLAFLQPEEPGDREPAVVRRQAGFALAVPSLDFRRIGREVCLER